MEDFQEPQGDGKKNTKTFLIKMLNCNENGQIIFCKRHFTI